MLRWSCCWQGLIGCKEGLDSIPETGFRFGIGMCDNDGVSVADDSCSFDMLLTHGVSIEYLYK